MSGLDKRVKTTQHNIEVIAQLMETWKDKPMFKRTDTEKKQNLLDVEGDIFAIHT